MSEAPRPTLCIRSGNVYDPARGIDGDVHDVWLQGDRIIATPDDPGATADRTLDAAGMVVMPGGVDMHSHIAGPKVNAARKLRPEAFRGGEDYGLMTIGRTARRYLTLGYTTVFDAAVPPLGARHADEELQDATGLDAGYFITVGNNHYVLDALRHGAGDEVRQYLAWLLHTSGGYAPKLVNPGGVEAWKQGRLEHGVALEEEVPHWRTTPRHIMQSLAEAADALNLPHGVHIHGLELGLPGNAATTLATMQALDGRRAHLTHVQFHSYAGGDDNQPFGSGVEPLVKYFNEHDSLSIDVGQVLFGRTTSMTGDGPLGRYLQHAYRTKWAGTDVENEAGCGIAPIEYKSRSQVHAWQFAIGLEWFLLAEDPWRLALTTDHPNGTCFLRYPELIRLLMDADHRAEVIAKLPKSVRENSPLRNLDRSYTLDEICTLTRAAPARLLGLPHKGTLAPGADADVAVYAPNEDFAEMFALPRWVVKAGRIVAERGVIREDALTALPRSTLRAQPDADADFASHAEDWYNERYSLHVDSFRVR